MRTALGYGEKAPRVRDDVRNNCMQAQIWSAKRTMEARTLPVLGEVRHGREVDLHGVHLGLIAAPTQQRRPSLRRQMNFVN